MSSFTERRYGRFLVDRVFLEDSSDQLLKTLMGKLSCVVKCEMDYATDQFWVTAACEVFDSIELGTEIPWYQVFVTELCNSDDNSLVDYEITFKKDAK